VAIYTKENKIGGLLESKKADFLGFAATEVDEKVRSLFPNIIIKRVKHACHEAFVDILGPGLDEFCDLMLKKQIR
jgi:hypothetical protein